MKKLLILTLFTPLIFGLASCKKKITEFYITDTSQVVVQSNAVINIPFNISTPDMETNYEGEFEANDTRKENIDQLKLTQLKLEITDPTDYTFSWLESVEIYISSDNLPEKRVAFKTYISDNVGKSIVCDVEDVNLGDYIQEDAFKLRLNTVTDEYFTEDVYINLTTEFFVKAKIFKN
ncbi:hypothetical protein [Lishizhenia sp.]|uniref:hypothetical protein n=1 Tax=Lishizhenia sp. TaxID=2497594 RepID=UPI00299D744E|nr:hypothetical protein [Lishizhenia sp.]MDX1446464.1 hypothetical protein [Lishizhenia sp.]